MGTPRARDEQHGRDLTEAGADDVVVEQLAPGHRLAGMAALSAKPGPETKPETKPEPKPEPNPEPAPETPA